MTSGRATASMVELSGTRMAPLARPSISPDRTPSRGWVTPARSKEPHRSRRTVDLDLAPVADARRRVSRPDDRGQPELPRDDRRVRQHAARVGDEAAGDGEHGYPRGVRGWAHDDVARPNP